jgi:hypothetical protein
MEDCERKSPNCSIRKTGGQRQDKGATRERKQGGHGQGTGRRAITRTSGNDMEIIWGGGGN